MSFGEEFRAAYRQGEQYRAFGPEEQRRLEHLVPEFLRELWRSDGWAGYRNGLLWTVDPQEFQPIVNVWNLPGTPPIAVARTAFGSLYLLREFVFQNQDGKGFAILELNPHTGDYMLVGPTADLFLTEGLAN